MTHTINAKCYLNKIDIEYESHFKIIFFYLFLPRATNIRVARGHDWWFIVYCFEFFKFLEFFRFCRLARAVEKLWVEKLGRLCCFGRRNFFEKLCRSGGRVDRSRFHGRDFTPNGLPRCRTRYFEVLTRIWTGPRFWQVHSEFYVRVFSSCNE